MSLTQEQKMKILDLHFNGITRYTDLAKMLKLPYNSVNAFMTKWKKSNGIIKTRKPRRKEDDLLPIPSGNPEITVSQLQELKLLRHFYKMFIEQDLQKNRKRSA